MNTPNPTLLIANINGQQRPTIHGVALLLGCEPQAVKKLDFYSLPAGVTETLRQRLDEAATHHGTNELLALLAYWADKDHDAIAYTDHGGNIAMLSYETLVAMMNPDAEKDDESPSADTLLT